MKLERADNPTYTLFTKSQDGFKEKGKATARRTGRHTISGDAGLSAVLKRTMPH